MIIIVTCVCLLLIFGILEQYKHQKNVDSISIRVNVNGIRGKSTVTRLITAVIKESGYKTVGKTTGTSARMIYWFQKDEKPIIRKPQGPNIGEQMQVIKEAFKLGTEALVCECMAVNPDYQEVFQEKMLQANIGVIVNVLEDHMDVMGPTLDQVAEAFTNTIPYNGYLIITDGPYVDYFKEIASTRNTKVIVADNSKVSEDYLRKFDYMVFPDNVSLALAVAEALEIDENVALRGMLKANPDPGALTITKIGNFRSDSSIGYFVNGFAANDASSTLRIWDRVCELGYPVENPIIIMNCRPDRVDRTEQFAEDVLPYMDIGTLVTIGKITSPITQAYNEGLIKTKKYLNLEELDTEQIMEKLHPILSNKVIYGIGNIHGSAETLIEKLMELKIIEGYKGGNLCLEQTYI